MEANLILRALPVDFKVEVLWESCLDGLLQMDLAWNVAGTDLARIESKACCSHGEQTQPPKEYWFLKHSPRRESVLRNTAHEGNYSRKTQPFLDCGVEEVSTDEEAVFVSDIAAAVGLNKPGCVAMVWILPRSLFTAINACAGFFAVEVFRFIDVSGYQIGAFHHETT